MCRPDDRSEDFDYEGKWEDDKMSGPGSLTDHAKGFIFVGQMAAGRMEHGVLKDLRKGTEYAGPIDPETQMPSGYGSLNLANGDKYAGDFDKGKMHG